MNYAELKKCDIANGPGVRVSLFVSGCTHRCPGCFNEVAWDFHYGEPFTEAVEQEIITALSPSYIRGLTLLGGEPLEEVNRQGLFPFLEKVRAQLPQKDIWCYTGYVWGRLPEGTDAFLPMIDVLVDGRFELAQKDISLRFRGSANQRIIDVRQSLLGEEVVLWQEH